MIDIEKIKLHMSFLGYESGDDKDNDNVVAFTSDSLPSFITLRIGDVFTQRFPFSVKEEVDKEVILEAINKQNLIRFGRLSYKEEESMNIDYYFFGDYDKKWFGRFVELQKNEIISIVAEIKDILK
jgi:hypothetical protein